MRSQACRVGGVQTHVYMWCEVLGLINGGWRVIVFVGDVAGMSACSHI